MKHLNFFKNEILKISQFFINEEIKTERAISVFRSFVYFGILMEIFSLQFILKENIAPAFFWIVLGFFAFSVLIMLDLLLIDRIKVFHAFIPYLKYWIALIDTGMVVLLSLFISDFFSTQGNADLLFNLVFMMGTILLLMASMFRYHVASTVFTGSILFVSFFIAYIFRHPGMGLHGFIFKNNVYQLHNALIFWLFLMLVPLAAYLSHRIRELITKSKRQDMLERFLPQSLTEEMEKGNLSLEPGGKKTNITVLFSDIRNFTSYSEKHNAEEVVDLLNGYFNDMIEAVFRERGTLDKMIGDGLMAFFGEPYKDGKEAERAVRCAIEMQRRLAAFNELQRLKEEPEIRIGIGIHSGEAIVGNIGSQRRMDFTAIGDTVNTASRLETLTKKYKTPILISEETQKLIGNTFDVKEIGKELLKGKEREVLVYAVENN